MKLAAALLLSVVSATAGAKEFFSPAVQPAVAPEIREFVNNYLQFRILEPANESARRMKFDEVEVSFPLTRAMADSLSRADGIALSLDNGRRYSIVWTNKAVAIGMMSFPASHNLIRNLTQPESFDILARKLTEAGPGRSDTAVFTSSCDSANVVCRPGGEFFLGHIFSHTYINAMTSKPIFAASHPAESLANLFVLDSVPSVRIDLTMVSYAGDSLKISSNSEALRNLLGYAEGTWPYFAATRTDSISGMVNGVAIYHNPAYAYIHKLDVTATLSGPEPRIRATLLPYIKLHNLKNLWGDKYLSPQ